MPQFIPAPAAGGGGASFAFDGATFTIGDWDTIDKFYPVTIELTLDSTPISEKALFHMGLKSTLEAVTQYVYTPNGVAYLNDNTSNSLTSYISDASYDPAQYTSYLVRYDDTVVMNYQLWPDPNGDLAVGTWLFYIWIGLPDGSIVESTGMQYIKGA